MTTARKQQFLISCIIAILLISWYPVFGQNRSSLSFQVNYIYRSGGKGKLKPISNGSKLRSGDHYKIVFTSDQDCFVYIFQVDSSGQTFQLFPMDEFKGVKLNNTNPVRAGKKYTLPSADKAFVLDELVGTEKFYFIGTLAENIELIDINKDVSQINVSAEGSSDSTQRRKTIEPVEQGNETPQEKLDRYFKQRGIVLTDGVQKVSITWENKQDSFTVFEKRLNSFCDGCAQSIQFIHE